MVWIRDRIVLLQRDIVEIYLAALDPDVFTREADDPLHVDTVETHGVAVHHDVAAFQRPAREDVRVSSTYWPSFNVGSMLLPSILKGREVRAWTRV